MIEKILIENYRGIEKLEVNNFKKYNLFVGDNSSCKTTLLEALYSSFLINPSLDIITVANYRGMTVKKDNIYNLIYNADLNKNIVFTLNDNVTTIIKINEEKTLENSNLKGNSQQGFNNLNSSAFNQGRTFLFNITKKIENQEVSNIDYYLDNFDNKNLSTKYNNVALNENLTFSNFSQFLENKSWISPYIKNFETAEKVKNIIENKKKDELLSLINRFEPEIDDIFSDGQDILLSKKNIDKMLLISSFGNGLLAIVNIISHIVLNDVKFLFIDEIESGIHYLNYKNFCSSLIEITNLKNIQLFISTHSKEFLKIFYEEIEKTEEDISLYRFQKVNGKLKDIYYSKDEVITSIKNNWEVR